MRNEYPLAEIPHPVFFLVFIRYLGECVSVLAC